MFSRLSLFCCFASLPLAASPALSAEESLPAAERYSLRLEYLWWSPQLSGELQKGFSDAEGTVLSAQTDLGIQDHAANRLQGTLRLGGRFKLRGSWTPLDYRGDTMALRGFVYGTTIVVPQQRVVTSLKGNYWSGDIVLEAIQASRGFLGVLGGVRYFEVNTALVAVIDERNVSRVAESERLPLPVVGITARAYPTERFSLEGDLSGLRVGDRGQMWELLLAGRVHVSDRIAGTVGWRKLAMEGRDHRDYLKIDLARWSFGVEISL